MPTQTLVLDGVLSATNLTGATIANLNAIDGNWAAATSNDAATDLIVSMPTPAGPLTAGAGLQTLRIEARKSAAGGTTPSFTIAVREGGVDIATSAALSVASELGSTFDFTFDGSIVADPANVEVHLAGALGGGSKTNRRSVGYGYVSWIAAYNEALPIISGASSTTTDAFGTTSAATVISQPAISGTASLSMDGFSTASATAGLIEGIGSGTLNEFGTTATAAMASTGINASVSLSIDTIATASALAGILKASSSGTLDPFSTGGAAKVYGLGAASLTLDAFLTGSAAAALIEGAGSGTLNDFGTAGAAKVTAKGESTLTLDAFTAQGTTGAVPYSAVANLTLGEFSATGAAVGQLEANAGLTLDAFTTPSAAAALVEGVGSGNLNAFEALGAAVVLPKAAAAIEPDAFTVQATGGVVALPIDASVIIQLGSFRTVAFFGPPGIPIDTPASQLVKLLGEAPRFTQISESGSRLVQLAGAGVSDRTIKVGG